MYLVELVSWRANIEKNSFLQKSLNNRQYNVNRQRREIIRIQVPINRWIVTNSSPIHREKVATSSPITRFVNSSQINR